MADGTYADYATALRALCGNNRLKEHVLYEPFYRNINRTTRALVKQHRPKIRILEEAVEKATEISDPIYNVSQAMENIGQAFVTAPESYMVAVNGTTGQMAMIPGIAGAVLSEEEKIALLTNPRGVYNKFTSLYEEPKGRKRNGSVWDPSAKKRAAPPATAPAVRRLLAVKAAETKAKVNMVASAEEAYEGGITADDSEANGEAAVAYIQPVKKQKVAVGRQRAATRQVKCVEALQRRSTQSQTSAGQAE
ncbi:hypothetical protein PHMEG_00015162 [Phytophthora megakarya]|uniref:Uncharacterized protein n=1 Tax=Phytophthora megakarya TaxID=4795 RepID=A0A225W3J5_9STRA|nr:hypothetical protein PHMEG_00015162 [Phytophthora megakarya]